jgi:DNA topoisomerase II
MNAIKLKINKVEPTLEKSVDLKKISLKTVQNVPTESKNGKTTLKITPKPSKNIRVGADNYSKFENQRDHVYEVPNMYLGSIKQTPRLTKVLDLENLIFKDIEIVFPQGAERIFLEISSNAGDNAARSKKKNVDPGEIVVTMTETTIKVRNGGIPIPVEIHPKENMYVPEMIFGNLLSGSNYNKERSEAGVNGLGSKLTNIFSKFFKVTVADPFNEKLYTQIWTENMKKRNEPVISDYSNTNKGFVEIEYIMDFKKFGYEDMKYPREAFELFNRHILDMAFTMKTPVSFNGKKFNISTAKEYAKLYLGKENVKHSLMHYEWEEGTEIVMKKGVNFAVDKNKLPIIEICAVDTPDRAERISFVNGMWTRNNGVHLEAAFKAIGTSVLNTVNDSLIKKKKGEKKNDKSLKLTLNDVKKHVSIFVNCWIVEPEFDSQSKNELRSPTPKVSVDEKVLASIMKWELVSRLYAELDAKQFRAASKSDGKKKRYLSGMEKLHDANRAATIDSINCTLYITEGDSALTFAKKLCSYIPGGKGRDFIGMYPLKGKPLNVMNAPATQIAENKEINDLKKVLGLREGVDYRIEENYETLRYGHLMVLADADVDGLHILGLVMNLFHCKYPTLLARGYIKYLRTKILEAKKGKEKLKFYTQHEYEEWLKESPDHATWKVDYFKGLGTSEDEDILEESKEPKIVMTLYDDIAPYSLRLAFDQSLSNNRKMWVSRWEPDHSVAKMKIQPISKFIDHEFIQFSLADIARSIPRFTDGLKVSQRKIIWAALKKWKSNAGSKAEKFKVAQFAASISASLNYHHGEKSLEGAIVALAQNYVGSNNLPYLERNGQFGTRSMLGKDASAGRYIFTKPEFWIPLVFKSIDNNILDMIVEEGQKIEPVTLLPILPMHLINGVNGIGSGFSSTVLSYNPIDICYWIEAKIKGFPLPELIPWYRDFQGYIEIKERKNKNVDNESSETDKEDEEDKDEVNIDKHTKYSMISKGDYEIQGKRKVIVTELPVGRGINKYKSYLDKFREDKIINKYDDYSTPDKPHFEIYGMKNPSSKNLKLIKSYGMSNMVLLDNNNKPVKYEMVNDILETFYTIRLGYYQKRKDYILKDIEDQIKVLNNKINFILAVIKGYEMIQVNPKITLDEVNAAGGILAVKRSKKEVSFQMEKCGFDPELLKKISLYSLTLEEVQSLRDEIMGLENKRKNKEETKIEQFWLDDLEEFLKAYCKHYKCEYEHPKDILSESGKEESDEDKTESEEVK